MQSTYRKYLWTFAIIVGALIFAVVMGAYRNPLMGVDYSISNAQNLANGGTIYEKILMAIPVFFGIVMLFFKSMRSVEIISKVYPIFTVAIIAIVSSLWSVDPQYTLFKGAIHLAIYLYCLAVVNFFGPKKAVDVYLWAGSLVIALSVQTALFLPKIGVHLESDAFQSTHAGLWRGVFGHRTALGQSSAYFCVFLIAYRKNIPLWLVATMVVGCVACMALAQSSGAYISVTVGVIAVLTTRIFIDKGLKTQLMFVTMATVIITIVQVAYTDLAPLLLGALGKDATLTGRTEIWDAVLAGMRGNTLYGMGYSAGIQRILSSSDAIQLVPNAQSGFLDIYVAFGLLGMAVIPASWMFLVSIAFSVTSKMMREQVVNPGPIADGLSFCVAITLMTAQLSIGESFIMESNNFLIPTFAIAWIAFITMANDAIKEARRIGVNA